MHPDDMLSIEECVLQLKIREKAIHANFHSKAEMKALHDDLTERARYLIKLRRGDKKGKVGWKPKFDYKLFERI